MTETSDTVSVTRGDLELVLHQKDGCVCLTVEAAAARERLRASLSAPPAPQGERVERLVQLLDSVLDAHTEIGTEAGLGRTIAAQFITELLDAATAPAAPEAKPEVLWEYALRTGAPEADIKALVAKIEAKCNGRVWLARDVYGAWDVRCEYPGGDHYCGTGPDLVSALHAAARKAGEK